MPARGCREPAKLADFGLGHLDGPAFDQVAGHIPLYPRSTGSLPGFQRPVREPLSGRKLSPISLR
jgi:hypothetical protein